LSVVLAFSINNKLLNERLTQLYKLMTKAHRETSGVQLAQHDGGGFHYRRVAFSSQFKAKTGSILAKSSVLCLILNIDGSPIISKSHTHPSHSETSHLLTSSLSLGVLVPRATQCM
jgi:hypothetical protein